MRAIHTNPERHYRQHEVTRCDEQKFQIVVEESDLWITLPASLPLALARDTALKSVFDLRAAISAWAQIYPDFRHSLTPLPPECAPPDGDPSGDSEDSMAVVRAMDRASRLVGVGPFAAVAGAIAQGVAERLLKLLRERHLPPEIIVENGGDMYLYSQKERVVALLPMPNAKEHVGLRFGPEDFPLSLCASSATIGHSLSFGCGDLALTRARNAALADAAATAYGNMLKGAHSVALAVQQAGQDAASDAEYGLEGLFVQCDGKIGLWGKLELTALKLE